LRSFRTLIENPTNEVVVIIVPKLEGEVRESYVWYPLALILREVYHEFKGRLPETLVFTCTDFRDWLESDGRLSRRIVVADWSCVRGVEGEKLRELIRKRLLESLSQDLGFVILLAEPDKVLGVESEVKVLSHPHIPKIVRIDSYTANEQALRVVVDTLCELFKLPRSEGFPLPPLNTLPKLFADADREYKDFVQQNLQSKSIAFVRRDVGEEESEDHIAMKVFAVNHLIKEFNTKPENIYCTYRLAEGVVADIYAVINNRKIAVECETLFGTGPAPLLKIFETVRKYSGLRDKVSEVWVIIRNWGALLHLGNLIWAEKVLSNMLKQEDIKVKFYTINILKERLEPLDSVAIKLLLLSS